MVRLGISCGALTRTSRSDAVIFYNGNSRHVLSQFIVLAGGGLPLDCRAFGQSLSLLWTGGFNVPRRRTAIVSQSIGPCQLFCGTGLALRLAGSSL